MNNLKHLILLNLVFISLNGLANCKTKVLSIENNISYEFFLDECGVKPLFVRGTFPKDTSREAIKKHLISLFSSVDAGSIQGDFYDANRVVKNIENIDISKWHKLNKNYEFCYQEKIVGACREFVRIKFRGGNLQFTYNRVQ